jgi:tetratricopeptide (TPR) repeat protein
MRDAHAEAAEAYARALAADQTDNEAKSRLASMLVMVGRYSEAIPLYEQMIRNFVPGRGASTVRMVARAYLGIGDEQKAVQVLRQDGLPIDQIGDTVSELRRLNSQRR